ncbi:hypothetical protein KAR91_50605 [Candidatus Pacearchaeota archaeon]|nr:hypothetical protein [Candidatus Pacearchaeota archaeon]
MEMQGWIKLHRKLLDNPISSKPQYCHLWVCLLLMAQHDGTSFIWNNEKITVNTGQVLTGRKKLSQTTGIPESTIEKILKYLEIEQQIAQQKTTKYRIITIIKWGDHQKKLASVTTDGQQRNNRGTTEEQQRDTYKKEENGNNGKKDKKEPSFPEKLNTPEFIAKWSEWVQYRKESKKKLTVSTTKKQLDKLAGHTLAEAMATIETSIEKGWTGLFPEKQKGGNNGQRQTEFDMRSDFGTRIVV